VEPKKEEEEEEEEEERSQLWTQTSPDYLVSVLV
jgi:hypothetical protein